jgi:2-oxoglutarate dehydrogenase E1 component
MNLEDLFGSGQIDAQFFDEMYNRYKKSRDSVDTSWRDFFDKMEGVPKEPPPVAVKKAEQRPPSSPTQQSGIRTTIPSNELNTCRIHNLIEAYRMFGHLAARINPLQDTPPPEPVELYLSTLGFNEKELFDSFPTLGLLDKDTAPLKEIIDTLKEIYCGTIGVEYLGVNSPEMEKWLQDHIEPSRSRMSMSIEQKQMILQQLNKSELFESFLHTKYVGQKRFSLEGGETLIPMLEALVEKGASLGVDHFILGMAHRGRLNVLSNIMNKSYSDIFSEFEDIYIPDPTTEGTGDVKYHKGFFAEILTANGHRVQINLTANPSHLESVIPVVLGETRAIQTRLEDKSQERAIPVIIHGDAAVTGQGVVYESMQMGKLDGYSTGGAVHIVVNNQIGFTTLPSEGRSTRYTTDVAHTFNCPVFHVNAEDPEGCVYAMNLAMELRHKFLTDVFIDLLCYRKYGHNEADEPAFTQPNEYKIIKQKKPIRELYRDHLVSQGVLEKFMAEQLEVEFKKALQQAMKVSKEMLNDLNAKKKTPEVKSHDINVYTHIDTGVSLKTLQTLGERLCTIPEGFTIHPKMQNVLLKDRLQMVNGGPDGKPVDWGMAESLAYATLLIEGIPIRISGQDSQRGTFSHRHAVWVDQQNDAKYTPFNSLSKDQAVFEIYNSPLSEFAVLGFDYGYSMEYLQSLTIWEAQFGDFSNGGQVIIDEYISSGEQKWGKKNSLVMFLPHGYEGQGPDHSSARIERYINLAGKDNMIIVYPSTPLQFFHLLRRHMLKPIVKPTIVFTPKGLLRHPDCHNAIEEFTKGSFQEFLEDKIDPKKVKRLVFCYGHIYYDLAQARKKTRTEDIALIRIEQLYPLNTKQLQEIIQKYPQAETCFWVQPEPRNMGAWEYLQPIIRENLSQHIPLNYIGRERSGVPAVGAHALHKKEQQAIIAALFPTDFEPEIDVKVMQPV